MKIRFASVSKSHVYVKLNECWQWTAVFFLFSKRVKGFKIKVLAELLFFLENIGQNLYYSFLSFKRSPHSLTQCPLPPSLTPTIASNTVSLWFFCFIYIYFLTKPTKCSTLLRVYIIRLNLFGKSRIIFPSLGQYS